MTQNFNIKSSGSLYLAKEPLQTSTISLEEMKVQNRRLLPEFHKNELHIVDTENERLYVGIIDFLTRYTALKRMENFLKKLIHPPLSYSTVHPEKYAHRFQKFVADNSC